MPMNAEFREAFRAVTRGVSLGEIVERTGISYAYVNNMSHGRVPSLEKLNQLAVGLGLVPTDRSRLLRAAGHEETARMETVAWPPDVVRVADVLCGLNAEQLALVEQVARQIAARVGFGNAECARPIYAF